MMVQRPALNINPILFMRILSISNKKHNISNITCNVQGWKTGIFVGIGKTNSPYWSWVVDTQVTDILSGLTFQVK